MLELDILVVVLGFNVVVVVGLVLLVVNLVVVGLLEVVVDFVVNVVVCGLYLTVVKYGGFVDLTGALVHSPYLTTETFLSSTLLSKLKVPVLVLVEVPEFHQD